MGYCSESFPGQSCNVVCDFGRNNVPLCQEDGTWTDIPRCIEHDPGVDEQIPGTCPSIPGYCAQGFLNHRCTFDCVNGPDIDSLCSLDGTWEPYPTCQGDLRETRDGCDGCPGPAGGARNRTAEAILNSNTISDRRVPKVIGNDGGRKNVPSFAGNINIGRINAPSKPSRPAPRITPAPRPTPPPRQQQTFQTSFAEQPRRQPQPSFTQQPQQFAQQPRQQFAQQPQQQFAQQPRQQFAQQPQRQFAQQPRQQFAAQPQQQPQQSFNQGLNRFQPGSEASQPLSLFDQIKNKINQGNAQQARQQARQQQPQAVQQPQFRPQPAFQPQQARQRAQQSFQQPQQSFQQPQQSFQNQQQSGPNFGVFEAVSLGSGSGGPSPPEGNQVQRSQPSADGFFGVFPEVNLQS